MKKTIIIVVFRDYGMCVLQPNHPNPEQAIDYWKKSSTYVTHYSIEVEISSINLECHLAPK